MWANRLEPMFYTSPMLWTEDAPTHCPNGHPLGPDRVLVGWDAGRHGSLDHGHRIFICRQCDTIMPWSTKSRLQ